MKKLVCLLLLCVYCLTANAQTNLIPKFIRRLVFEKDSSHRSSLIPLPVFGFAPETGVELGGSILYSFYTDTLTRGTRVSNIFTYGTFTTKGQNRFSISTSYWKPGNKYHYTASISYIDFPSNFYGIGNATLKADAEHLLEKRIKLTASVEKLFGRHIYLGAMAGSYNYNYSSTNGPGIFETDANIQNRNGGASIFGGPSFTFDSRNNNTYTTKGILFTSSYSFIKGVFENNNYSGGLLTARYSEFLSLSKRLVLGLDVSHSSLIGSQSPFYLLPTLGNDEKMRGYYNGRYRDKNYTTAQTELRYRVSDRLAFAGFTGAGTVYQNTLNFDQLKPNYGGGIRYFFDVEKGLTMRIDYGLGEKRPGEERQSGFYIELGEAF